MSRFRRFAPFALATVALLAAIAQGAGAHAHALLEVDLAPHAVMSAEQPADCGPQQHLENATPHRHAACGSCALASTPSSTAAPVAGLAAVPATPLRRSAADFRARACARGGRGPARAPPAS